MYDKNIIEIIFETFQELLVKLNLEDNIIGYTLCLTLLCLIAAAKILTICCVLRKVKNCKTVSSLDEIDISEIILKMQALEYLLIGSAIFFIVTFFWLLNVIGIFDCFKSSPVKSAFHCLNLILSQSDQILAKSSSKIRQTRERVTQASSTQLVPYTGV